MRSNGYAGNMAAADGGNERASLGFNCRTARSGLRNFTGTRPTASVDMSSRSRVISTRARLVVCLTNGGYEVSLEPRKIYAALPDADAAKHDQMRVVDESGEDYLFPASLFAPIVLRGRARQAVLAAV